MDPIVAKIISLIEQRSMTRSEFMKRMGMSPSVFSTWASGKSRTFERYLDQIAAVLGVKVEVLTGTAAKNGEDPESSKPKEKEERSGKTESSPAEHKTAKKELPDTVNVKRVRVRDGYEDEHLLPESQQHLNMGGYTGYVTAAEWDKDDVVSVVFDKETQDRIPLEYRADAYYMEEMWKSYGYGKEDLEVLEENCQVKREQLDDTCEYEDDFKKYGKYYNAPGEKHYDEDDDDEDDDDYDDEDEDYEDGDDDAFDDKEDYFHDMLVNFRIANESEFRSLYSILPRRYQMYVDHMFYLILKGEECI